MEMEMDIYFDGDVNFLEKYKESKYYISKLLQIQ
jgi:hypothetical protein